MPKPMSDKEAIQLIERVRTEIKDLRGEVDRLRPKADAYDLVSKILGLIPGPSVSYGEDIVWNLDKRLRELQAEPDPSLGCPV